MKIFKNPSKTCRETKFLGVKAAKTIVFVVQLFGKTESDYLFETVK